MAWSYERLADVRYALSSPSGASIGAVAAVGGYAAVLGWAMTHSSYDIWGGLLIGPALLAVSLPFLLRVARRELDVRVGQLLIAALVLKLLAAVARYYVAIAFYDGYADALSYHDYGRELSGSIRGGDLTVNIEAPLVGTGFLRWLTAFIYVFTGPSVIGGYLVLAWLGFWGLYNFYRAFTIAFPTWDRLRYALPLFLLPSMLFWPSGLGKDAWMLFTLGLAANGGARLLADRRGGLILLAAGLGGQLLVRPHVAVLVVAGLGIAYVIRRRPVRVATLGPIKSVLIWSILGLAVVLVIAQVQRFFGLDEFTADSVDATLAESSRRTGQGGSGFATSVGGSPLHIPRAVLTVLYRPFPFEAHNFQSLLAAAEGALLLLITVLAWRRLRRIPGQLRRHPYIALCLVYTLLFCYAFGHFQNFGILTRERVQVFPFVFVLLAIPRRDQERFDSP